MRPSIDPGRTTPAWYLLSTVAVWIVVAGVVEFTVAGGRPTDAVVTGTFGGLAFGVATLLVRGNDDA
ncbi:hypothetical protein [Halorubrum halodurans]|uniref:DUF2530 domain-containing protein n=1 Tax=Halorubrum halodurans TaxID=1383851 RepID=A0A256IT93_9EURY|nr:hypothetical protein [Halorubrum halodurans]OYR59337.1 hypothetical protein DJ70_00750 [Halorubrum halodurans]